MLIEQTIKFKLRVTGPPKCTLDVQGFLDVQCFLNVQGLLALYM